MTGRSLPEWIGRTPDSRPPPHVRARIFETHNGMCHLAKRKINAGELWDLDHVIALINGGENRESNLAPALRDKHKLKTADDVAEKSRNHRKRAKHIGAVGPRKKIASAGFPKSAPQHTATRPIVRAYTHRQGQRHD